MESPSKAISTRLQVPCVSSWLRSLITSGRKVRLSDQVDETHPEKLTQSSVYWTWKLAPNCIIRDDNLGREEGMMDTCLSRHRAAGRKRDVDRLVAFKLALTHAHTLGSPLPFLVDQDDAFIADAVKGLAPELKEADVWSSLRLKLTKRCLFSHAGFHCQGD